MVIDVSFEQEDDPTWCLKVQSDTSEINVRASWQQWQTLRDLRPDNWEVRRSLQLGRSAGAQVFWAAHEESVTVLVGADDEVWDIAIELPAPTMRQILHLLD